MQRLLGARAGPFSQAWPGLASCLLCQRALPWDGLQLRYRSSTASNVMLSSIGKKLKRKAKKYAELLEVTDSVTNNRKAAVQKFNAAQISLLVDQPEITLDKLHKIKSRNNSQNKRENKSFVTSSSGTSTVDPTSKSGTNFSNFPNTFNADIVEQRDELMHRDESDGELLVEDLQDSGIMDESVIIKSSSLARDVCKFEEEPIPNDDKIDSKESTEPHLLKELEDKISVKERKAREALIHQEKLKQFNRAILGYVNVCVNSDTSSYKNQLLKWGKFKKSDNSFHITDISVYNAYIEKLASKSDLRDILQLLQFLRREKIVFNTQIYTHILECVGRMNNSVKNKLEILEQIREEMKSDGISVNDVMTKSTFVRDQRMFVENMVKLLDNDFKPVYELPDITYDCRLLENLSEECATPSSTVKELLSLNDLENRLKKQIEIEIDGQVTVHNIAKHNTSAQNVTFWRHKLSYLEAKWEKIALHAFKRNLAVLKNDENFKQTRKMLLHPYLSVLKPEDYVRILLREAKNLGMGSEMYSLPFTTLCRNIGVQVYKMYEAKTKQKNGINDKTSEVYMQYCDWFIKRDDKCNSRIKWTLLEHEANKSGVTLNASVPSWQSNIHIAIGKFLYNVIMNDLKIDTTYMKKKKDHGHRYCAPAFFKIYRHSGVMLKEEIKPHPLVAKLYRDSQPETLTFDTTLVPSLCPPRPWISIHHGGYIVTKTDIVRVVHMGNQQWDRLVSAPPKKLYPALDSLNQLGSIPWTVNSSVLDIAIKVFQNNGSVELNMPQPPSVLEPILSAPKNATTEEKKKIDKARIEMKRKKNEMYSLWCDALYRLSLANHFRNEIFWLPHNMDFRGRVYPIPPHLNHLGSDLARSMLIFALKKPLGPNGLDWLKLHVINLTGFKKKEPIRERLKFANDNIDKILDSAEKPLTGTMWWATSDEPWQTLAACMEISAALKSPNPEKFMSGFPIHQDGSCNGLQHYAALGRDQIGAESVNLYPSDSPQDVYSSVAAMVDEKRKEDAEDPSSPNFKVAQILEGFVRRKVIKQTVMTTVYGVTRFGARLQIARQLKDLDDFPDKEVWMASNYLVKRTFQTLRTMFKSAREIQDWFTECARLVCITRDANMEWVTPLGLPVIQPYSRIMRSLSNKDNTAPFFTPDIYRKPNVMKQKNAFAPNFVHSIDSSHMMLTSIHSEHAGLTFVSVHDCYWTHPCTVEIMNKVCREQFVALHSEPILEDLSKFLVEKFAFPDIGLDENNANIKENQRKSYNKELKAKLNATLRKVPQQGDFDLKGVLSSTYFFS